LPATPLLWFVRTEKDCLCMSVNNKRSFTIMVIPHSEESTYSARLPLFAVQLTVAFLVLLVAGLCLLVFSYFRVLADAREVQALRELNRAQQEEINALAAETQRMMEQVKAIDDLVVFVTEKLDLDVEEILNDLDGEAEDGFGYYNNGSDLSNLRAESLAGKGSEADGVLDRASQNIIILQSLVPERSETLDLVSDYVIQADAKPSIWPARGRIASGFGMRKIPYASGYQFHTGVDIIGAYGSEIWASAEGRVIYTGYRGSYGHTVVIDHGYGYETLYAHLSGFAVDAGALVKRREIVGYMGASGRTTGTHLHYEVLFNGSPVNPANYMQ
jgi:murein DD-endopeptidase MepM/ murein hydrolase activator NlpD